MLLSFVHLSVKENLFAKKGDVLIILSQLDPLTVTAFPRANLQLET